MMYKGHFLKIVEFVNGEDDTCYSLELNDGDKIILTDYEMKDLQRVTDKICVKI